MFAVYCDGFVIVCLCLCCLGNCFVFYAFMSWFGLVSLVWFVFGFVCLVIGFLFACILIECCRVCLLGCLTVRLFVSWLLVLLGNLFYASCFAECCFRFRLVVVTFEGFC